MRSRSWLLVAVLIAALFFIGYSQNHGGGNDPGLRPSTSATPSTSGNYSVADLPKEARQTLALIDKGGPYPYRQDNTAFGNRERRLPAKPGGYYREFTVMTPGSDDRGARRLIRGEEGETYYTNDHYASFHLVERN